MTALAFFSANLPTPMTSRGRKCSMVRRSAPTTPLVVDEAKEDVSTEQEDIEATGCDHVETTGADAKAADDGETQVGGEPGEVKLSTLSVPELQAFYTDVVGRETRSSHRGYLQWKIRQAQKGKIPVGPRRTSRKDGEAPDFKVLPVVCQNKMGAAPPGRR